MRHRFASAFHCFGEQNALAAFIRVQDGRDNIFQLNNSGARGLNLIGKPAEIHFSAFAIVRKSVWVASHGLAPPLARLFLRTHSALFE
jgi:hypothetical protein